MLARCTFAIGLVACLDTAVSAQTQATLQVEANPATLGEIEAAPSIGTCGPPRAVTFTVSAGLVVGSATVSMAIDHPLYGLRVALISPGGVRHDLFPFVPYSSILLGTYTFADRTANNFYSAAEKAPRSLIPPGTYRTVLGPNATSIDATFSGQFAAGVWTLRSENCVTAGSGSIMGATLRLQGVATVQAQASRGTLGAIPDGPSGASAQTPGPPRDVTFIVPPGTAAARSVRLSATLTHAHLGDVVARLIAPNGRSHVLFGYTGATNGTSSGSASALNGTYEFRDGSLLADWWLVAEVDDPLPSATYTTSELGGPGSTGAVTSMDAVFAGAPSSGTWVLRLTDGFAGSVGSIAAATLTIETATSPTTQADVFGTTFGGSLAVAAPGVLANDGDNLGGAISAELVAAPGRGVLALSPSGAFTYAPAVGFAGTDSFTYRATNSSGPGNVATVSITVAAPTTVQPPTEFVASSVVGHQVTLRWTAPVVGPTAADYVIEGGLTPGQTLGAATIGSARPIFSFSAPTGAFYLRVHAVDAAGRRSGPSNEIPLFVNTAAAPSAPATLTGAVNGNTLGLSWRNTFAGGAPTSQQLNVSGTAVGSLPVPLSDTFSFAGIPAGTYTFRVRAVNATGTSLDSNPVTLTFPSGCTGTPLPPDDFLAYAIGNVVHLVWNPPASGTAATNYVVTVGGSFSGSFPFAARSFSSPAPSGAYTFSVASVNACGTGATTAPQTVFVP